MGKGGARFEGIKIDLFSFANSYHHSAEFCSLAKPNSSHFQHSRPDLQLLFLSQFSTCMNDLFVFTRVFAPGYWQPLGQWSASSIVEGSVGHGLFAIGWHFSSLLAVFDVGRPSWKSSIFHCNCRAWKARRPQGRSSKMLASITKAFLRFLQQRLSQS